MAEAWELGDQLHLATSHRDLAERLAACEAELELHRGRLDGLDRGLSEHADSDIVIIEDSDGASVEIAEADATGAEADASGGDIAESESTGDSDAAAEAS